MIVLNAPLLNCIIFCMYVNCVLTEHLAECKRLKSFPKCKVVKINNSKSSPSPFSGFTFLYLPNVYIYEPKEFIHVRVVKQLSKFKVTIQRLTSVVLTYSVSKGDFQIILPSGWNLLSVTLWCLHPGHCDSSTHLLYNFVHHTQFNQFDKRTFLCERQKSLEGT